MPLIQISDDNPTGTAETHMRNVKVIDNKGGEKRALANLGGGPRRTPKTEKGVPIYLHDWFGTGQHYDTLTQTFRHTPIGDFNAHHYRYAPGRSTFIVETDEVDHRRCLEVQLPYLGPVRGFYTDWTPLTDRPGFFPEDIDPSDPCQFRNILVH